MTLGSQLTQRRAHEHPDPLIGRADRIWLGHRHRLLRSGAVAKITRAVRRPGGKAQSCRRPGTPRDAHRTASSSRQDNYLQPAPLVTGISGGPSAASPPAAPATLYARRLPARSARSEKAYAASTTPEIPITPALPPQSIPEGPSRAAHISG